MTDLINCNRDTNGIDKAHESLESVRSKMHMKTNDNLTDESDDKNKERI